MLTHDRAIVFLATMDPARSRDFYEKLLGLKLIGDDGFAIVFDTAGAMLRVVRTERFEPQPFTVAGWEVPDVHATLQTLADRGLRAIRYEHLEQDELGVWTTPGGERIAWFHDPEGNLLSISQLQTTRTAPAPHPDPVLDFWLGPLDEAGFADPAHAERWWQKSDDFDDTVRRLFALVHARAAARTLDTWCESPRGRLALVIVLDQFSRNMYRGSPGMFAFDQQALALALAGIEAGDDQRLHGDERVFLYMPLMHSEDLAIQEHCVALFEALVRTQSGEQAQRLANNLRFAQAHRDIIIRFGRFPHRNVILGRPSTEAEIRFLAEPGSSF